MTNTDFSILLKAELDKSGINTELKQIQEIVKKYHLELTPDLQTASLKNQFRSVCQEMANDFNKAFGTSITGNDMFQAYENKAKQLKNTIEQVKKIQLSMSGQSKNDYNLQITKLIEQFKKLGISEEDAKNKVAKLQEAHNALNDAINKNVSEFGSLEAKNKAILTADEKRNRALNKVNNEYKEMSITAPKIASELSRLNKVATMQKWADNNSKAMKKFGNEINDIINKMGNLDKELSKTEAEQLTAQFKKIQNEAQLTGNIGKTTTEQIKKVWDKLGGISLITGSLMTGVSKFKESISEIKDLDNTLTEISKTSDLTTKELKELGMAAYDTASKYGRTANDYLSGVESMSQSGFYGKQGEAMAEQSLLAQAAGDMSQEIADQYVIATNAAYKFNGEAEKLNAVLDGQNSISNRNSVALEDMATAMSEAGTVASSYNVAIEDLSAMIGTMEAVTKSGGSEVGNSLKSILINLQNVTSDKITSTLNQANASMTEMVNGAEKLRNPIEILRDLAETFNSLDEGDPLRAEILTNIGGRFCLAMQKCIARMNLIAGNALEPCTTI